MAVTRRVCSVSYPAQGDLSASQFCIVAMTAEGRIVVNEGMATANLGILLNKPTATGQAARVAIDGSVVKMIASAALPPATNIMSVGHYPLLRAQASFSKSWLPVVDTVLHKRGCD